MASSDNLASIEPWAFRQPFADSWISEAFARDAETLTKALQKSHSNNSNAVNAAAEDTPISRLFNLSKPPISSVNQTQTQSGSGSEPETTAAGKRRNPIGVNGKPTKRKSRASKRTTTTFITADPANFRQMVQQVTGVRFGGNGQMPVVNTVLKPEAQRPVNRMQGCLPTLDTSAFLLDQQQQQQVFCPSTAELARGVQPSLVADGGACLDFDSFSSFPTLESWKVM